MNTFGRIYRLTSFGESHGPAMGGIIDGIPPGKTIDLHAVQSFVDRRRPGTSPLTSQRAEPDTVRFLSGLMAVGETSAELQPLNADTHTAITLGTPIGFIVENRNAQSADYSSMRDAYRPSHADFAYDARYGLRDWRGGGRASGRETVSRVVAGAVAMQLLDGLGIRINARICAIGELHNPTGSQIEKTVEQARASADSIGGIIECTVEGMPAGIGEPVFGKLQQMLASAMLSIGAVKGFDYGMGFDGVGSAGSRVADIVTTDAEGRIITETNHSGGIQGGISNGMDIRFRVAVKPTPSIPRDFDTVDRNGRETTIKPAGRHDPCILLRIAPVVEAMAAMVILDAALQRSATDL